MFNAQRDPCIHTCTHIHSGQCIWSACMHVRINIHWTHTQCIHTHFQFTHMHIHFHKMYSSVIHIHAPRLNCMRIQIHTHLCRLGSYVLDIYSHIHAYITLHYIKTYASPCTNIHLYIYRDLCSHIYTSTQMHTYMHMYRSMPTHTYPFHSYYLMYDTCTRHRNICAGSCKHTCRCR